MMNNKKIGNITENKVAEIFRENEYWVYITPLKTNGQPVDIIAINNSSSWLVDAKHVNTSKPSFTFDRIEPNQITSLMYANNFAKIQNLGFAIEFDRDGNVYWLSFQKFVEMSKNGQKSINMNELELFKEVIKNEL